MKYDPISRRIFLQGLGGYTLLIPLLPSILHSFKVNAQVAGSSPNFISLITDLGQVESSWRPNASGLNGLVAAPNGYSYKRLSNISGPINDVILNHLDEFREKMNFIQGTEGMWLHPAGAGHQRLFPLSAFSQPDKSGWAGNSIDTLISKSASVYASEPAQRLLSILPCDSGKPVASATWFGSTWEGGIIQPQITTDQALFNMLFPSSGNGPSTPPTGPSAENFALKAVDRVLPDLQRTISSTKIGNKDKQVLQQFADQLNDLENRIRSQANGSSSQPNGCTSASLDKTTFASVTPANYENIYSNIFDTIILAMSCGLNKVSTIHLWDKVSITSTHPNDEFCALHDASHWDGEQPTTPQRAHLNESRTWAILRLKELLQKMSSTELSNGENLLDESLILYTSELSRSNRHDLINMPVMTFGGAKGKLNTGYYIDYGMRPYNELMIAIMMANGLNYTDWETDNNVGFGYYNKSRTESYGAARRLWDFHNTDAKRRIPLPMLLKGTS